MLHLRNEIRMPKDLSQKKKLERRMNIREYVWNFHVCKKKGKQNEGIRKYPKLNISLSIK
jgi:hypothetical protein